MPTVEAAKIKIRRGSNLQRQQITLDEGELGYTIDTKRVFAGDGSTVGGNPVGQKTFLNQTFSSINGVTGDIALFSNILYALSGSNSRNQNDWVRISPAVDGSTISYNTDGVLTVNVASLTLSQSSLGNGLTLDSNNKVTIDISPNASSQSLLTFDGNGALSVGTINDDSHGVLNFQNSAGLQHHSNATSSTPGFMSAADKSKLDGAVDFNNLTTQNANDLVSIINNDASILIAGNSVDTSSLNGGSSSVSNSIVRVTGTTQFLSGGELTTPFNFLNREDFPGVIINTSIPPANISTKGEYCNIVLGGFADGSAADYVDKIFLLPSANGNIYSIIMSSDSNLVATYTAANPQLIVEDVEYNADPATLRSNVVNVINNITNDLSERLFEAWVDGTTIYIHGLVRGFTPAYSETFSRGDDATYYIPSDVSRTYTNGDTSTGTGSSAGTGSNGKISASLFGWLKLESTTQDLLVRGQASVSTVSNFPAPGSISNGNYFLIYDSNYNRTCVYYDVDGTATQPDLGNSLQHRGFITTFVKVDISSSSSNTDVAAATNTALNSSSLSNLYTITYDSNLTITFTSINNGYTDGIVNRPGVGLSGLTVTSNDTEGTPVLRALYGAFYNTFGGGDYPEDNITVPSSTGTLETITVSTLLKFR